MNTTHNLPFLSAEWEHPFAELFMDAGGRWNVFSVGTVSGQWRANGGIYEILSFINTQPHNGHLEDVFQWFENSCKRDGKSLLVKEVWNKSFKAHLILKRGFTVVEGTDDVIKHFTEQNSKV